MSKKEKKDLTLNAKDLPYRPCVGIVVFNRLGKVWAGRRLPIEGSELSGAHNFWQFPQGGIDKGEDPYEAALRELWEETGIKKVSLLKEADDWLNYDLPEHLIGITWKGKYRGQKQKWFAFAFEGTDSDVAINPPPAGNTAEFDSWQWVDLAEMLDLVVPFKKSVYEGIVRQFAPIEEQIKQANK
ncbi:RNA pyrophosphohydrolase [Bartonella sp. HY329]|uniref:RNA pyrophosphohydrolase n=1 Tax=unclassified Bartonella TaxID=2645622 RepID=UPI0021C741A0|nr:MULTISPECIES: RNA pyrophosphohydrolase [unclassified Bartonella]UXM94942.1 RNA pyrophosphohydrolase [Bartonella sp. HY329]UXN09265.1 RNA pyrophosphohydrolase [Bartonella sp. HY328]